MIDFYKKSSNFYINKLAFPLLYCLFFILPFGNVAELDWVPILGTKAKLQTIIGIIYILLGVASGLIFRGLYKYPSTLFFIGLILILTTSTIINVGLVETFQVPKNTFYPFYLIFLFLISAGLDINKQKVMFILFAFLTSMFFTTLFSILDFWGLISIDALNKELSYTTFLGYNFECLSGYFNTRTSYAFLISMALTTTLFCLQLKINKNQSNINYHNSFFVGPVQLIIKLRSINSKNYYYPLYCVFFVFLYAGFATHQRALILTLTFIILIIFYIKFKKHLIKFIIFSFCLLFVPLTIIIFTGDTYDFNFNNSTFRIRLYGYIYSFVNIPANPLGTGYGLIEDIKYSMINPHNSYLYIIISSGIYSFILYLLFMFPLLKGFFRMEKNDQDRYLFLILICWFLSQIFHNVINSSFGWCFMGILVSYINGHKFKLRF